MRAAGIRALGAPVELLDLPPLRPPGAGEVLISVAASGVGNWDEFVRTGGWDPGVPAPLALGFQTAGVVAAAGDAAGPIRVGDRVTTFSLPLRQQGAWAGQFLAAAAQVAAVPDTVSLADAAVLPIPALTAEQALAGALAVQAGETVVVHGAGGVTGGLLVQLAAHYGARVIATAGPDSADRTRALGAASVLDYHDPDWSDQARALAGRGGADAAANAAPGGAGDALRAVRDGGRLVTITGDAPATTRGISVSALIVAPDGPQLGRLTRLLADGAISVTIGERYRLDQAAQALDRAGRGAHGTAIVLDIEDPR